jgi:hypothetical protein
VSDILNDELERMWKEVSVAYSKEFSQHFPEGIKENQEKPYTKYLIS